MSEKKSLRTRYNQFSARHPRAFYSGAWGGMSATHIGILMVGAAATPGLNVFWALVGVGGAGIHYAIDRKGKKTAHIQVNEQCTVKRDTLENESEEYNRYEVSENQMNTLFKSQYRSDRARSKFKTAAEISDKKRAKIEKKLAREAQFRRDVLASKNVKCEPRP